MRLLLDERNHLVGKDYYESEVCLGGAVWAKDEQEGWTWRLHETY